MIVCVAGNPSVDKLFEVESLTSGEIHRPGRFLALPGGKGIHVAQVATALGQPAVATGILAGHSGRWLAETLAEEGVGTAFAWGAGETRASLSVLAHDTGLLTEFYEDGIPAGPEAWQALVEIVEGLLDGAEWLALAGSLPAGPDVSESYPRLMAAVPVALDSRGEALAHAVPAGPEVVKINAYEASGLLGRTVATVDDARVGVLEIRALAGGDGHGAVITLGERGMVLADPEGEVWHGAVPVHGAYPVGSGDALLAGLLTGLSREESWTAAAALGLGAAAANAEIPGAARLDPERARALAAAAELRPLRGS
jgi:1-phosphofructokinase family hexose kinase